MKYTSRYPGVKPFETEEQHIFFGRSFDIQSLYDLVGVEKTVLLYSKSGLGKSSLINAGLIPKLREDKKVSYIQFTIRFGVYSKAENKSPKQKIIDLIKKATTERILSNYPELRENTISFWVKSMQLNNPGITAVLIFDQFEELFTYPEDQITEFKKDINELLYLKTSAHFRENIFQLSEQHPDAFSEDQLNILSSVANVRLLFAIRSDYLSMLNHLTDYIPNLQRTFYELKPLEPKEARNAIIKPAGIEGDFPSPRFEFTKEAIEKIVTALSDNGKQPIETFQLQIVCKHAEGIILKNQQKITIHSDDLGDIRDIHQSFYNNLMAELKTESEEEKVKLRVLLEEQFIYEPEQRRLQVFKGIILKQISEQTLSALEKTHLIRSEPYQDSFTYELSHDTLVEPILKSYHLRKEEEERKESEKLRQEELRIIKQKTRRQRNLIIVFSIAALISVGCAIFGFYMWNNAKKALKEVEKSKTIIEIEKTNAENALLDFQKADKLRKETEVTSLLNDARSFEMYGKTTDAIRSVEKALKIDSANKQAVELLRKYRK